MRAREQWCGEHLSTLIHSTSFCGYPPHQTFDYFSTRYNKLVRNTCLRYICFSLRPHTPPTTLTDISFMTPRHLKKMPSPIHCVCVCMCESHDVLLPFCIEEYMVFLVFNIIKPYANAVFRRETRNNIVVK